MSNKSDISAELNLDISGYTSSISRAISSSDSLDAALSDLIQQSNKAETALSGIGGDVNVEVDTDYHSLLEADDLVNNLDSTSANVDVKTDSKDAKDDIKDIKDQLGVLKTLGIINLAITGLQNIPGPSDIPILNTIIEADTAARSIVASLGDMGKANAPVYTQQAQDVYASGAFESQQEAADALTETIRLTHNELGDMTTTSENFGKVTELAWVAAHTGGVDFEEVIRAADTLVDTGLAPDYQTAMDIITKGFQEGLDKGGQFLDTINEKSTVFKDLGIDAQTMLGILKTGLEGGAKDAATIGEIIGSLDEKIKGGVERGGADYDLFRKLGLSDESKAYKAGEITGGQFITALLAAIEEKKGTRGFDTDAVTALFGGKVQDLTLDVALTLDPAQVQNEVSSITGTTLDAQLEIMGGLGTSWETLKRTVETELASSVSTAFDIPGKIEAFNEGVRKFSDEIQNGATIPQAIEMAFEIPGFATTVASLESALGNLGITLLQVSASILDAIGQGGAATTVRETVATAAAGQMAFDLKLNAGNEEAIAGIIRTAIDRGVEDSALVAGIQTAGEEFISAGDLDSVQAMITSLQTLTDTKATITSGGGILGALAGGITVDTAGIEAASKTSTVANEALTTLQTSYQDAQDKIEQSFQNMRSAAESKLPGMAEVATSSVEPVTVGIDALSVAFTGADLAFTNMNMNVTTNVETMGMTLSTGTMDIDDFAGNTVDKIQGDVPSGFDHAAQTVVQFGYDLGGTMRQAVADVDDFIRKFLSINNMEVTVPTPQVGGGGATGSQSHAAGGVIAPGNIDTVHGGEQLIYGGGEGVAVLNRQTSSAIDAAMAQYLGAAGMMGGGNTTVNNYVNMTFNNMGAAASAASLNASQIRGF